ncbi:DUF2024 family protein [Echinimonas agarilytica]|uniref:DUF2024 family protein n=1 Tax=Echinimonas agarilytica TaxID=1215918 RepID=A0AA41W6B2_9GAMM|nr:DUF2024 family protein [Echinimonas agarilytica]MCM2679551.1 DUF2024 family protein [Echinimonas agarilytica]
MEVFVFDTHVKSSCGKYLHFDVFLHERSDQKARDVANEFITSQGIEASELALNQCDFCHREMANPAVASHILQHGSYILPMEGCR